ncbi:hypothetical protein Pedsa_3440 [Pseudopedobacter saltans DSM 12145]|uniref:Peptidyl-prolyl cis-trans isomerase n=1 Tax=Pseudopedobacter saltans (strain ATCC 51119 / DSM 12145 / JCM 21818 / CCUG 39354 / LMG 10337 / NBRC 100064 / NCIMB 13643) TaxID=762903 RepID=F0SDJ1_PSESL|nr:hypothetical protein [Pseudopedobacter saltans]ADY53974.1 hypothetical protein Pedsa_3440 [Pseudopedobacter saltans DSM 12145]
MRRMFDKLFLLFGISLAISSCRFFDKKDEPIARAFDEYLYKKDVAGIVPHNVHGNDSIAIVKAFIDQWQQNIVLLKKAERNVSLDERSIQEQLETYKRTLIRYQYEQELIQQKLDTIVSEKEIEEYYNQHKDIFLLKKPILKISYIKLPEGAPKVEMVKKLFVSKDVSDRDLLEKYCFKYSPSFSLLDTNWHYIDDLSKSLPLNQLGEHNFQTLNRIFQISENNTLYLLILRDSKFRDSLSPLTFEKENIRNMILNHRKLKLISQMEREVFLEAQKNNELEVY